MINPVTLVEQMIELSSDKLPDRWEGKWKAMAKATSNDSTPYTLQRWMEEVYFDEDKRSEFTKEDIAKICELVGRMLRFEPSTRASANTILEDSWFERFHSRQL